MSVVVIVKARFDSETLDSSDPWRFKAGDLGTLQWRQHRKHPRFVEACVIWDRDPKRKVRRVILSAITVVGLQSSDARVLLLPLPE
jgi:hypothetical protein